MPTHLTFEWYKAAHLGSGTVITTHTMAQREAFRTRNLHLLQRFDVGHTQPLVRVAMIMNLRDVIRIPLELGVPNDLGIEGEGTPWNESCEQDHHAAHRKLYPEERTVRPRDIIWVMSKLYMLTRRLA
jgi:hypothetical protein